MSEFTLIEAANGGKPKVAGLAYGGGKMNLPGWKFPVVYKIPSDHNPRRRYGKRDSRGGRA